MKHIKRALAALVLLIVAAAGTLYWMGTREDAGGGPPASGDAASLAERGRYLALAGNCMACHTSRGGKPMPAARRCPRRSAWSTVPTSRRIRRPASAPGARMTSGARCTTASRATARCCIRPFPTPSTRMTRADADALYAFLRTVEPVNQPNRPAEMEFPYNQRALLAFWRALYFRRARCNPTPASRRPGTEAAIWSRGRAIARPAIRRATAWAPRARPSRWPAA